MRARLALGVLALSGCNLIFGLEEATDRPGGEAPSGGTSTGGGGASDPTGAGGEGGAPCPPEVPAGAGVELLPNGSFEGVTSPWVESGLAPMELTTERDCGCQAVKLIAPDGYSELRGPFGATAAGAAFVRARARAGNDVALELQLRVDDVLIEPPRPFAADASDGEADGWRTASGDWLIPAGQAGFLMVVVDGNSSPRGAEVVLDCVSLTQE